MVKAKSEKALWEKYFKYIDAGDSKEISKKFKKAFHLALGCAVFHPSNPDRGACWGLLCEDAGFYCENSVGETRCPISVRDCHCMNVAHPYYDSTTCDVNYDWAFNQFMAAYAKEYKRLYPRWNYVS